MGITSDVVEETPYEEIIEPTCPSCRQSVPWEIDVCPHCGYQFKGKVKPKEAPKAVAKRRKRGKKGTVVAAASVIAMGILAFLSVEYWPPAALILLLAIVVMVVMAAAPE
jgi:hypothetical protein